MPKRSAEEKIEHYNKKIKKLKKKSENKNLSKVRKRILVLESSDEENNEVSVPNNEIEVDAIEPTEIVDTHISLEAEPQPGPSTTQESDESVPSLDPDLIAALGESTEDTPEFGDNIHESLCKLWPSILKKGLAKEVKDKILEKYLIPGNCRLLQAPKLNAEISAALSDLIRNRDKKIMNQQQQLGLGITTINRGMGILLNSDNKVEALKHFSDSCRILTDLHFISTQNRIKLLTPSLEKSFLTVVQDTERDDTLFGNSLAEKIKASKAIEKQGLQIKKAIPHQKDKPSTSISRSNQGNWFGPPRHHHPQMNRGGRGTARRMRSSVYRPQQPAAYTYPYPALMPPPPPPPPNHKPPANKPRAPQS